MIRPSGWARRAPGEFAILGIVTWGLPLDGVAQGAEAGVEASPTVTVFASASLTDAFRELGAALGRRRPGLRVRFNFAGSQQLATQIEQGASADLFASADQRWMRYAQDHDLVEGEAKVFVHNRLVVIMPRTNPARIGRLEHLARRGIKLVVAAEAVPVGKYTLEALLKLSAAPGFPADYSRRVLANVVSQEENVKSVVSKVQLGEADAGIAYRSDVTPGGARFIQLLEIPEAYNVLASYPIALLKNGKNAEGGRAFFDLVLSDEGQRVLQRHGLIPAAGDSAYP